MSIVARLGDLAVWNALYVAAAVALLARLAGAAVDVRTYAAAALLTASVYLLDRARPHDALHDPADDDAHPRRSAFMRRHRAAVRGTIVATAVAAAALLWTLRPFAALLVPAGHAAVLVYAALPGAFVRRTAWP